MFFGLDRKAARILAKVPGRRIFGLYRYQPIFFVVGALLEFSMITWEAGPGKHNFYKTFRRTKAREIAEAEIRSEELAAALGKTPGEK